MEEMEYKNQDVIWAQNFTERHRGTLYRLRKKAIDICVVK